MPTFNWLSMWKIFTKPSAILLLLLLQFAWGEKYSSGGARNRFEERFSKTCMKYDFVKRYMDGLSHTKSEYVIFVFHERGQTSNGGLGDRLAGMINAIAFAIRSNRRFLIEGDAAFEDSFKPYHPTSELSWNNWEWAGWKVENYQNMTKLFCVNPRPRDKHCALDQDWWTGSKVIKYYGNRSYMCRWLVKPSLGLGSDIYENLQIDRSADLYEIAGCLLRLAIWPTEKLWSVLDQTLEAQLKTHLKAAPTGTTAAGEDTSSSSIQTSHQLGFHFRCGDSSFVHPKESATGEHKPNPECYYDPALPWKGTVFMDDKSVDTPVDIGNCGKQVIAEFTAEAKANGMAGDVLAYIASDNSDSSNQINATLSWNFAIKPPPACHVDIDKNNHCTMVTSLHWFMLSLSDTIVMQALIKPEVSAFENSPETKHLTQFEVPSPISAFSRYAAIYSLSKRAIRYGKDCIAVNRTALSQETHGNWICDPLMFY